MLLEEQVVEVADLVTTFPRRMQRPIYFLNPPARAFSAVCRGELQKKQFLFVDKLR